MHPQFQAVADEFDAATRRLQALRAQVPGERWPVRSDPDRWSVSECVLHLVLTAEAFIPLLQEAVAGAVSLGGAPPARYRRDLLGWIIWRMIGPPVRHRTRTAAAFIPGEIPPADIIVRRFDTLQDAQLDLLARADGRPVDRIRIPSPFDPRFRYSAWSAFTILPRHQHRHLWQAEGVWGR